MNPFPADLGDMFARYSQILVPEINLGQLSTARPGRVPRRRTSYNKVQGVPFDARWQSIETEIAVRKAA